MYIFYIYKDYIFYCLLKNHTSCDNINRIYNKQNLLFACFVNRQMILVVFSVLFLLLTFLCRNISDSVFNNITYQAYEIKIEKILKCKKYHVYVTRQQHDKMQNGVGVRVSIFGVFYKQSLVEDIFYLYKTSILILMSWGYLHLQNRLAGDLEGGCQWQKVSKTRDIMNYPY